MMTFTLRCWGAKIRWFFDHVYRKRSRFCVTFISKEFAERIRTNHERRSAQARALEEKSNEYILPVRIDETELPGMLPTTGYVPAAQYSIEQIAGMVIRKLRD